MPVPLPHGYNTTNQRTIQAQGIAHSDASSAPYKPLRAAPQAAQQNLPYMPHTNAPRSFRSVQGHLYAYFIDIVFAAVWEQNLSMDEVTLIYRIRCFLLCKGRECERTTGACCVRALAKDFLTIPGGYYTTQTGRYLTMQADTATFQGSASPDYIMYARSLYAHGPFSRALHIFIHRTSHYTTCLWHFLALAPCLYLLILQFYSVYQHIHVANMLVFYLTFRPYSVYLPLILPRSFCSDSPACLYTFAIVHIAMLQ